MANTSTVTRKLKALGLPVELVRGDGYHYFIFDDIKARNLYESESIMSCRFDSYTEAQWIEMGVAFATKVEAEYKQRSE